MTLLQTRASEPTLAITQWISLAYKLNIFSNVVEKARMSESIVKPPSPSKQRQLETEDLLSCCKEREIG
jgi:hypothetical protein